MNAGPPIPDELWQQITPAAQASSVVATGAFSLAGTHRRQGPRPPGPVALRRCRHGLIGLCRDDLATPRLPVALQPTRQLSGPVLEKPFPQQHDRLLQLGTISVDESQKRFPLARVGDR